MNRIKINISDCEIIEESAVKVYELAIDVGRCTAGSKVVPKVFPGNTLSFLPLFDKRVLVSVSTESDFQRLIEQNIVIESKSLIEEIVDEVHQEYFSGNYSSRHFEEYQKVLKKILIEKFKKVLK